ncbi:MAG TPA: DeoR/GlpR family DNA-binding transcription regulator [Propionicimonas sp.]|jgi:DeoR family fructose operon transcriptional repressor|nr:DeoR/GlpR family DNA-binding transcription regulator [Propionicimonas sp.]
MSKLIQYERKQLILEQLRGSELAHIEDLVDTTGASPSTVRRDIDALVKSGRVIALRGGAIKLNERPSELPTSAKKLINREAKQAIAAAAAELVNDGDTVYIDSGTTTLQLMPLLRNRRIHVITSNTQIFTMVPGDKIRITILAGDWIAGIGSIAGSLTERLLNDLYFDKAFIGASGCSAKAGINTFDIREATKKRIVQDNSQEPYVLLDSSKFGKSTLCKALDLGETSLITDEYHELLAGAKSYLVAPAPDSAPEPDAGQ